jgi:hypothetical protein
VKSLVIDDIKIKASLDEKVVARLVAVDRLELKLHWLYLSHSLSRVNVFYGTRLL